MEYIYRITAIATTHRYTEHFDGNEENSLWNTDHIDESTCFFFFENSRLEFVLQWKKISFGMAFNRFRKHEILKPFYTYLMARRLIWFDLIKSGRRMSDQFIEKFRNQFYLLHRRQVRKSTYEMPCEKPTIFISSNGGRLNFLECNGVLSEDIGRLVVMYA